jgi:hypothetical protein
MSEKRKLANRKNALKSTGPKTEAGKARSKLNATKHGAYATVCLEDEDSAGFKALLLDLFAEYNPRGFEENLIVNEIAETIWCKNRFKIAGVKALQSYRFYTSKQAEQKGDVGLAMAQDAAAYGTIPRCLAAEDLLYRRLCGLFDRLRKLQKKRRKSLACTAGPQGGPIEKVVPQS